ncbi:cobaltochelatase subunit CobN [Psychrosphaera sp. F3M07]|uniref:cobaltochelatase subunit CobN n=1 Tax=Psychrosphaera sp. F3M07 TaxID=2841560 RepID=UPI001C09EA9D|nr:cobaltochelatase subunit CobN [Psychrosphaera sp. F3M07]MBU2917008.1 cobaltochelatase subunit CobN [Psychrosphaera sp. F3M07]
MLNIRLNKFVSLVTVALLYLSNQASAKTSETTADPATSTKVLFISAAHSNRAKVTLLKDAAKTHEAKWSITHKSTRDLKDVKQVEQLFNQHQFIVLDGVSKNESEKSYQAYLGLIAKSDKVFFAPGWLSQQAAQKGINTEQQINLRDYWKNGGRVNLTNMLSYISVNVLDSGKSDLEFGKPIIFPEKGIYHPTLPNLIVDNLDDYFAWKKPAANQPKIALLFQRANIEIEQTTLIDETIKRFEDKGVHVVPFFFKLSPGEKNYNELLYTGIDQTTPAVDLIINFRNIHWANQRKLEFEQFGVPVLQALTYYSGNKAAWEADEQGIDAGMMAFTLVLPESAGVTDPMVVAAMDRRTAKVEVIDYQLEHLVNKAFNLTQLKYKKNQDKKITVFVWGDQDVGASFMNIPTTLSAITNTLDSEGYAIPSQDDTFFSDKVKNILDPFYRDYQLDELLKNDLAELMPIAEYKRWYATLPKAITDKITEHWGQPEDNFMAVQREGTNWFVLPRIRNGNMLVMRQPPRSDNKEKESGIFHEGLVPINHFYLAAYFYARDYWKSDAIVHLGTHGSQEYLGGKERGLSMYDQGNLAVWDTPVVYPFIVDDVGEAMQTKRRGRATVISHMTPPFAAAGLHGDISVLHELMHQYKQLDEGGVKQKTAKQIEAKCIEANLCKDIAWDEAQIAADFEGFYDALHTHMESIATANQPLGLHTFGELAETRLLVSTLVQMLGVEFTNLASEFEHDEFVSEEHGSHDDHDEDDKDKHSHSFHETGTSEKDDINDLLPEQELEQLAGYQTVYNYIVLPVIDAKAAQQPVEFDDLSDELKTFIETGKNMYASMTGIRELTSMSDFLSGKYIPVKTGGDPIRNPESLATGYNLYGFDPSKVPTKAAYEQGKELIEQMIADHVAKNGSYPDKMAFSLWSIETMRHYGVLEAQALYAMGVRPIWTETGRVVGSEIIPYSELGRPRVDVVLSATALYRDAFPNVMQRLAKAVEQVAQLKEDSNPIWRNSVRIKQELLDQGVSEDDAQYMSTVRVFSNKSGDYGSTVDSIAWDSGSWESDSVIADSYMNKMGYAFGADRSRWGQKLTNDKGERVNLYGKQLSGTDIALFSRSSNLYGMLSSDDPFEYFGALSLAVRNLDGKSPNMVVSNLRNANNAKAEDAGIFLAKELRTRVFHPRWIKEMQKEGYSGAVAMSSRMDNFFGWQVVDPTLIRDDQWDEFFDVYVDDKLELGLDEWFEKTNPQALARMMQRMLEAERKEYWETSPERLKKLVETYSEFVEKYNLFVDNEKLKENVTELATGFGLTPPNFNAQAAQVEADTNPAQDQSQGQTEQVTGQKLEQQKPTESDVLDNTVWYSILGLLFIFFAGFVVEWFKVSRTESSEKTKVTELN